MSDVIIDFRDRLSALMVVSYSPFIFAFFSLSHMFTSYQPFIKKLVDKDILTERDLDAKRLRPFRITAKKMELGKSGQRWAFGPLGVLDKMARAMSHLVSLIMRSMIQLLIWTSWNSLWACFIPLLTRWCPLVASRRQAQAVRIALPIILSFNDFKGMSRRSLVRSRSEEMEKRALIAILKCKKL